MTSRSDPYALPYSRAQDRNAGYRRASFAFVLTFVAILLFMASFAIGYARVNQDKVLPGVSAGGVSLSGLTSDQAANKLAEALPSLAKGNLVIDINGASQSVPYSSFDRTYDTSFMVDQAMGVGRAPNFIQQIQEQLRVLFNGVDVSPQVSLDSQKLADQVAAIAQSAQKDPISASLSRVDGKYVVTPAQTGLSVDANGAVSDAIAAVNSTSTADASISVHTATVPPVISTDQAQAAADTYERVVGSGVSIAGAELSTQITADELRGWSYLQEAPGGGAWQVVIERDPIRQFVSDYASQTDVAPTNATFAFQSGSIAVVPSKDGRAADVDATTDNIMAALQARVGGETTPANVELALASVAPTFTTDDATAIQGKVTKIGEWTTNYVSGPLNGNGVNIQIPTSKINGYVVNPGELFDYLEVIGPITSPPYTAGAAIIHGHTVEEGVLGGGMCSSSTTLFNAAMRAGLDMQARRNHTYYISRYPVGLDATVWIAGPHSQQTMSFVNDTQYPILIKGINQPNKVTFEIYGVPDGRTVQLSDPIITNAQTAQTYYEYTDSLPAGQKSLQEFTVDGFDSSVTRTVKDASGNVIHTDTWVSHYKTINGLILVGRYAGDPPSGTQVLEATWKANHP
ncbi:MAG TPA: VanW family protein [Candidatus Limnocylindrales bacterium]|jgi:vancomycin resistance protein YoaR